MADDDDDSLESPQLAWLRAQLATLDPPLRDLLVGRLQLGCTWVELGQQLGWHPRMAQRRFDAALAGLRDAAQQWADAQSASAPAASAPAVSAQSVSAQSASTRAG